ncbi:hypothetical protein GCM10028806_28530 [Spirosoma terrae]|uniref:DUF3168 domain-containing protein n=1 Tax=Spirosoma terrae TaxID=1968276 RepID=A0A6L9LC96_9BACT|nr:hypothetical protein [Spirosoma terrae]NDU97187.1 hypothetical protein [Spirosoma terrae]
MKTTFDQVNILYSRLSGSNLKTAITGSIYKLVRLTDSKLEDVVVNSLPVTNDQIQRGTANVNIYVPDITYKPQNGKAQLVPNAERLYELAAIATQVVNEHSTPDYTFWLVNQSLIPEPETNQHYINLRIDFRFFPSL